MRHRLGPLAAACLAAALPLAAQQPWPEIALAPRLAGLPAPTHVTSASDGSNRVFVVLQQGLIQIARGNTLADRPFLDIVGRVSCCFERGLLSVAFPPRFAETRAFYVDYTNRNGDTVIARYRVSTTDPDLADAGSEEILLTIPQPYPNHNGGQLAFGPADGFLYIAMGDGGSAGDPQRNGQNPNALLGKILRIDVESGVKPYGIPPSNPFANGGGRPEIWDLGLRNPWRFSFDRQTNELYIADVGQNEYEEIDVEPAGGPGGVNYGWNALEGRHCFGGVSCSLAGLTPPVVEYAHDRGCSVTGGFVYRGTRYPGLAGIYFYADYCSGRIWGLRRSGSAWESRELLQVQAGISSFGEDEAGEILVADQDAGAILTLTDRAGAVAVRTLPIVLDAPGREGASFSTELVLANRGTSTSTVTLTYTAASSLGASGSGTFTDSLAPLSQLFLGDAIAYLRSKGLQIPSTIPQGGTLRVAFSNLSSPDAGYAAARVTTPSGAGHGGVAFAAVRPEETGAATVAVFGLREDATDRSNLALANTGTGTIVLRVTLFPGSGAGASVPLADQTLTPGAWLQLDSVLSLASLTEGYAIVQRMRGDGPFTAYAVVNDRGTGDGSFLPAVPAARVAPRQVVPVLVETPRYQSELVLANAGAAPAEVTLAYVESLASPGVAAGDVKLTLAPRQQRILRGALAFLRSQGAQVGPAGGSYAGALTVRFSSSGTVSASASARTSARSAGGAYGVFTPGVPEAEASLAEEWLFGLRQDSSVRSNLAFVNGGDGPLVLHYQIFDGERSVSASEADVTLPAFGWTQVDAVLAAAGLRNGYIRVTRRFGNAPFLVYAVVNDGARPGVGTDDGSYIAMTPVDP